MNQKTQNNMESSVYERIIICKNKLDLTDAVFCAKTNISTGSLDKIKKSIKVSDKMIYSIVRSLRINEEWLFNGTGEMLLPGESQIIEKTENPWKDALVTQLKDENITLKEQIKMMMQTIVNLSSGGKTSFPNGIIGAGLFQVEKFGNIVRA